MNLNTRTILIHKHSLNHTIQVLKESLFDWILLKNLLIKEEMHAFVTFELNCGPLSVLIVSPFVSASLYFIALSMHSIKFFDLLFCPKCVPTIVLSLTSIISIIDTYPSFSVGMNLMSASQYLFHSLTSWFFGLFFIHPFEKNVRLVV